MIGRNLLTQIIKEALDYCPKENWSLQDNRRVLHVSSRSYSKVVRINGGKYVQKIFCRNREAKTSYERELSAQRIFTGMPWVTPILKSGRTLLQQPYFVCGMHPLHSRVDAMAPGLSRDERFEIALAALSVVLDLHSLRIAHRDFQATNLFYYDQGIKLVDFETMLAYPESYRPDFTDSYDLTGQGLPSPFLTKNMGFFKEHSYSVYGVLKIPFEELLPVLHDRVRTDFVRAVGDDRSSSDCTRLLQPGQEPGSNGCPPGAGMAADKRRILLIGDGCAGVFADLIALPPGKVVFFEPAGRTLREARRYTAINDLHHVSVGQGGVTEFLHGNDRPEPFDLVLVRPEAGNLSNADRKALEACSRGRVTILGREAPGRV